MARISPLQRRRRARRQTVPLRFVLAVVATMLIAFLVTLKWPIDIDVLSFAAADARPSAARFSCDVAYVNDGDTFRCQSGERIRLHAVAARERDETCSPGHPCPAASAASATARLESLVAGRTVECEQVGRSYNRLTAICWTATGEEVNCAMVRSVTAVVWPL
ncbi:hypothetical protein D3C71_1008440 [compost metagenome]